MYLFFSMFMLVNIPSLTPMPPHPPICGASPEHPSLQHVECHRPLHVLGTSNNIANILM